MRSAKINSFHDPFRLQTHLTSFCRAISGKSVNLPFNRSYASNQLKTGLDGLPIVHLRQALWQMNHSPKTNDDAFPYNPVKSDNTIIMRTVCHLQSRRRLLQTFLHKLCSNSLPLSTTVWHSVCVTSGCMAAFVCSLLFFGCFYVFAPLPLSSLRDASSPTK